MLLSLTVDVVSTAVEELVQRVLSRSMMTHVVSTVVK
jgi:hypothetical protein